MDNQSLLTIACLVASVLFIFEFTGCQPWNRRNAEILFGIIGMLFRRGRDSLNQPYR